VDRIYVARFAPSNANGCHVVLHEHPKVCVLDVRVIQPNEKTSVIQQLALHKKSKEPVFLPVVSVMDRKELPRAVVSGLLSELAEMDRKELFTGSSGGMEGMTLTGEIHENATVVRFQAWAPLTRLPEHVRFFGGLHALAVEHIKNAAAVEALTATGMLLTL